MLLDLRVGDEMKKFTWINGLILCLLMLENNARLRRVSADGPLHLFYPLAHLSRNKPRRF